LGDVGLSITTRILGLLVASIGMQFIITDVPDPWSGYFSTSN
jgi:small neutral amino acid transporter SnatA (MarC family)